MSKTDTLSQTVQIKDSYPLATYRGLRGTVVRLILFNKAYVRLNSYPGIDVKTLLIDRDYLEVLP